MKKNYSIFKKRIFRKDKAISNGLSFEDAETKISVLSNHYTIGLLGFPYYIKEEPETPTYDHTWSLNGHRVFGDIYCTKCFIPKGLSTTKCLYEKEGK